VERKDTNPLANKLIVWLKERLNNLARRKLLLVSINDLKTNNLLVRPTSMPVQDNH
jgi:aminoglycoside phosphotransferase (APT) family kinase protein